MKRLRQLVSWQYVNDGETVQVSLDVNLKVAVVGIVSVVVLVMLAVAGRGG